MSTMTMIERSPVVRWPAAVVLAGHGAIHAMGVALMWKLGEPGELSYAEATPEPGSTAGIVAGLVWALAGALFVAAAVLVVVRRSWMTVAAVAALLSLLVIAPMAGQAPMGVVVDLAVLSVCGFAWFQHRERA